MSKDILCKKCKSIIGTRNCGSVKDYETQKKLYAENIFFFHNAYNDEICKNCACKEIKK